ncbi:hypothetical protein Tco_0473619, partial [Tanacetum coccineum]
VRLSASASGSQPSGKHQVNSKKQDNSDYVCVNCADCTSSDNLCVSVGSR